MVLRTGLGRAFRIPRRDAELVHGSHPKGTGAVPLEEAEAALPENIRMLPALVIAFEDELPAFRAALGPDGASAMRFLSVQELSRSQRKVEGFFSEPKRVRAVFAPGVRIAALAVITATLAALVFYKSVWRAEDNLGKLKRSNLVLVQQSAKATALQKEVDALRMELSRMSAEKPEDIYVFLFRADSSAGKRGSLTQSAHSKRYLPDRSSRLQSVEADGKLS